MIHVSRAHYHFLQVHQETFGKSGCRRIVPGQYLGVDPKGRACMIGAIEKQKLVYILNRDSSARLTISSPLEAHKAHTIVHHLVGVDVGFENPMFACLELDYEVTMCSSYYCICTVCTRHLANWTFMVVLYTLTVKKI